MENIQKSEAIDEFRKYFEIYKNYNLSIPVFDFSFKWLEKNASQFGFYLSYPKNNIKGIKYEPWHWSYLENH